MKSNRQLPPPTVKKLAIDRPVALTCKVDRCCEQKGYLYFSKCKAKLVFHKIRYKLLKLPLARIIRKN